MSLLLPSQSPDGEPDEAGDEDAGGVVGAFRERLRGAGEDVEAFGHRAPQ